MSPDLLQEALDRILALDAGIPGERWAREQFERDLPGKWDCSFIVLNDAQLVGFCVNSLKPEGLRVHRLAVAPEHRGSGLGREMMAATARRAVMQGIGTISVKVPLANHRAIRFYRRLGFEEVDLVDSEALLQVSSGALAVNCSLYARRQSARGA